MIKKTAKFFQQPTLLFACLIAGVTSCLAGQWFFETREMLPGGVLMAAGVVLFIFATWRMRGPTVELPAAQPTRPRWGITGRILGAAAILSSLLSFCLFIILEDQLFPWLVHLFSLILFFISIHFLDRDISTGTAKTQPGKKWNRLSIVLMLFILGVAVWMRVYQIDRIPFGTWYDEADYGLNAQQILTQSGYFPTYVESTQLPAHLIYLIACSINFFGPSTLSIRLVSILFGLATVLAGYFAGRELLGEERMGLILAFLLAVGRWDVNWSRIGMHGVTVPFFELLTVFFLLRALRQQKLRDYALAGLAAGLGLCFYFSFRLFPLVVLLFLAALWIKQPAWLRLSWRGLVFLCLAALIVTIPVTQLGVYHPEALWGRMNTTSIFKDKSVVEGWQAALKTTGDHLMMFNIEGDHNGRHNLTGEPMLDVICGGLFVLGLALCLKRFRHPVSLFLPVWLVLMLAPGIFSLDYESPQSYRAIGSMAAAYLLVLIPIQVLWQTWDKLASPRRKWLISLPIGFILAGVGVINFYTYFYLQANSVETWGSFSTPETIIARSMQETGDGADYYVSVFYENTPTLRFLAPGIKHIYKLQTHESIPLTLSNTRSSVFFIDANREPAFLELKRYFPHGQYEEIKSPSGKTALYQAVIKPQDVTAIEGLTASYYPDARWEQPPALVRRETVFKINFVKDRPIAFPYGVEWRGTLYAPVYGNYQLSVKSPADCELMVDGVKIENQPVNGGQKKILLAKGAHTLQLRIIVDREGSFQLDWTPPNAKTTLIPISALFLSNVGENGLLGRFYANDNWQGTPALARVDTWVYFYFHNIPLSRPYTVEWVGNIRIKESGHYHFGLESIDQSKLWINNQLVVDATVNNQYQDGEMDLTAGLYPIKIRYSDLSGMSHIYLTWSPPGQEAKPIPQEVLFPPQGDSEYLEPNEDLVVNNESQVAAIPIQEPDLVTVTPALLPDSPTELPSIAVKALWKTGSCGNQPGQLDSPHGISLDGQGNVWMADTGNRQVVQFDPYGQFISAIKMANDGDESLKGPNDLVVEGDGNLVVLDSENPQPLKRFSPSGQVINSFGDGWRTYNPRGIGIDIQGNLYLADTGNNRALVISPSGDLIQSWKPEDINGIPSQMVDITAGAGGMIYLSDAVQGLVIKIMPDHQSLGWKAVAPSDTIQSGRIILGPQNNLYISDPEKERVVVYSAEGQAIGQILITDEEGGPTRPIGIAISGDGVLFVSLNQTCQLTALQLPDELIK